MSLALVAFALVSPGSEGRRISGLHHRDIAGTVDSSTPDAMYDSMRGVAEANPAILAIPLPSIHMFV